MDDKEFVTVVCPYCGVSQKKTLKRTWQLQVVLCNIEDVPGCDRYFAVRLRMVPKLEYYAISDLTEQERQLEEEKAERQKRIKDLWF